MLLILQGVRIVGQLFPDKPLYLDWCSHAAAKYACTHWHYSQSLPAGKIVKIGVWEFGQFTGCVLFSRGANNNIMRPFGLEQADGCELTRVALREHHAPVSRIVRIALQLLRRFAPGLRLVISYADANLGHNGAIYQAGNWVCLGQTKRENGVVLYGKRIHRRTISSRYGTSDIDMLKKRDPYASPVYALPKYRYAYALDKRLKPLLESMRKSYPKRVASILADAPASQAGEGRAALTATLLYE